jgi:glycosyltransferase involved in cell wall biosynthesis
VPVVGFPTTLHALSRDLRRLPAIMKTWVVRHQVIQAPLRGWARLAIASRRIRPGVTVVIVNWNSERFVRTAVSAVRRFSPADVRIIVVDNGSHDGSRAWLRTRRDVRTLRLPLNIGHEVAEDIGFLAARTEFVVSLDVDAFPLSDRWLDELIAPLQGAATVSGAHVKGGFVHPCCLAMRFDDFVERRHSFVARRGHTWAATADETDAEGWDTGWNISLREPRRHLIDRTSVRGPGDIGSVFGDVVYHNFYSTRFDNPKQKLSDAELGLGVDRDHARDAWEWAVSTYLGGEPA